MLLARWNNAGVQNKHLIGDPNITARLLALTFLLLKDTGGRGIIRIRTSTAAGISIVNVKVKDDTSPQQCDCGDATQVN
ncbi:unnamed protein product [Lampetra fluviatilis]